MKKIIVTGGAGFIGSNLAEELAQRDYHVTIIDDLSTGKEENIAKLLKRDNAVFVRGSIIDLNLMQKLCQDIDYVFHQAALPSVPRSIANPYHTNEVNITGTLNVLLAARDNKAKKVVFASSSSVYGDTPTLPKKESMIPNPQSPYAVTKLAGEYYCQVFSRIYGLPTVCLRYFNIYGPRHSPESEYAAVIPKFIHGVRHGQPPKIFGDGEQTRDFTFVKDVVTANLLLAESDAAGVFNVGKGENYTVNRLAELIISLIGNNMTPTHGEPRPGDVSNSLADISRIRSFGYQPEYSLEKGLKETIKSLT